MSNLLKLYTQTKGRKFSPELIFTNLFSGHFAEINLPESGFTEDISGINFRKLSLTKDSERIDFRESALFKDFAGVNLKLVLSLWS